eukprot:Selendium_serpulae@DN3663_c0_g1_i1.p1
MNLASRLLKSPLMSWLLRVQLRLKCRSTLVRHWRRKLAKFLHLLERLVLKRIVLKAEMLKLQVLSNLTVPDWTPNHLNDGAQQDEEPTSDFSVKSRAAMAMDIPSPIIGVQEEPKSDNIESASVATSNDIERDPLLSPASELDQQRHAKEPVHVAPALETPPAVAKKAWPEPTKNEIIYPQPVKEKSCGTQFTGSERPSSERPSKAKSGSSLGSAGKTDRANEEAEQQLREAAEESARLAQEKAAIEVARRAAEEEQAKEEAQRRAEEEAERLAKEAEAKQAERLAAEEEAAKSARQKERERRDSAAMLTAVMGNSTTRWPPRTSRQSPTSC